MPDCTKVWKQQPKQLAATDSLCHNQGISHGAAKERYKLQPLAAHTHTFRGDSQSCPPRHLLYTGGIGANVKATKHNTRGGRCGHMAGPAPHCWARSTQGIWHTSPAWCPQHCSFDGQMHHGTRPLPVLVHPSPPHHSPLAAVARTHCGERAAWRRARRGRLMHQHYCSSHRYHVHAPLGRRWALRLKAAGQGMLPCGYCAGSHQGWGQQQSRYLQRGYWLQQQYHQRQWC